MMNTDKEDGIWLQNVECFDCGSSDNLSIYEKPDGTVDGFCQTPRCGENKGYKQYKSHNRLAASYLGAELGIEKITSKTTSNRTNKNEESKVISRGKKKKEKKVAITKEEVQQVFSDSSKSGGGYRKIKDKYNEFLGIRTTFDDDGAAKYRWYPSTRGLGKSGNPKLVSYKQRICATKKFFHIGDTSWENDLFNQANCKGSGKFILIVGGEEDVAASVHMIEEYRTKRGKDKIAPIDVVSSIIGEGTVAKQCQLHYDFLDGYDNIVIAMDKDSAGEDAAEELLKVLPFQKVKIMQQPSGCKDPCDALVGGKDAEWIRAFYDSKKPKLAGVVSGDEMWDAVVDSVSKPLIPLPKMLSPLSKMLCGGLPYAEIINILAASGVGKTSITNELELFWIFEAPYKCGVISLEAGAGKFLTRLLSAYLQKNIARFVTPEDKLKFLEDNKEKCLNLFKNEDGDERFHLVDDKGDLDTLAAVKNVIEKMVKQGECKIIIIDPIQDILDSLSIEDQAAFVGWQKKIKARDEVTFINVNHTRKSGGGGKAGSKGGELTEEDMQGTSALYKSGAVNIILTRDKTAEDPEERNTTKVTLFKSRDAGETGQAGYLFYDIDTAKLHNKEDWVESQIEDL